MTRMRYCIYLSAYVSQITNKLILLLLLISSLQHMNSNATTITYQLYIRYSILLLLSKIHSIIRLGTS